MTSNDTFNNNYYSNLSPNSNFNNETIHSNQNFTQNYSSSFNQNFQNSDLNSGFQNSNFPQNSYTNNNSIFSNSNTAPQNYQSIYPSYSYQNPAYTDNQLNNKGFQQENQIGSSSFYTIPPQSEQHVKANDNILSRSTNRAQLEDEFAQFNGDVRQYYLKYIDNNSDLMPIKYRRKIGFINKINLIIPVGCVFNIIMAIANYIPENPPLAKKHFVFSTLLMTCTIYYSKMFIKQYQIQSYNELLNTYSENQIKEIVDKTIMINRNI